MAETGLITVDVVQVVEASADPSVSGIAAPISSIALLTDGTTTDFGLWIKSGTASTAWSPLALDPTTTAGDLIISNGTSLVRFPSGAVGSVLFGQGAGVLPAWQMAGYGTPITQGPDNANAIGTQTFTNLCAADHVHNIPAAAPVALTPDETLAEGTSTSFARADHIHNIATAAAVSLSTTTTDTQGVAATFARSDHTHVVPSAAAITQTPDQVNAVGTSASFARADHIHTIASATPVALTPDEVLAIGTSTSFARADHIHNIASGTAVSISTSTANAAGTGVASFARSNHTHAVSVTTTYITATTNATTTATSDGIMTTMTTTPVAGTYKISFSATISSSSGGATVTISVYSGGTQDAASVRTCIPFTSAALGVDMPMVMHTQSVVTVNGSQVVSIEWHTTAGTATAGPRSMILQKVA